MSSYPASYMIKYHTFITLVFVVLISISCNDDETNTKTHALTVTLSHQIDSEDLEYGVLKYVNEAGNTFSVEKLQYIISDIELYKKDGQSIKIDEYHFVDVADHNTLIFNTGIEIEEGVYSGLSYTFGLKEDKNITGSHQDLNALSWSWPEMLGGGYHFMKLEGRFINSEAETIGFATHMGTAREIGTNETIFHDNHFEVDLKDNEFSVNSPTNINLQMDLLKWYDDPHQWDLNLLGNMIMPNYEAQTMLNENGHNVFSLGEVTSIN